MKTYAHTIEGRDRENWHTLEEHLIGTGELSAKKAAKFGAEKWGRLIGEKHDFGKGSCAFQERLVSCSLGESAIKVDHSTAGAQFCHNNMKDGFGLIPAYCIAGHHTGLLNAFEGDRNLSQRLSKNIEAYEKGVPEHLKVIPGLSVQDFPEWVRSSRTVDPMFSLAFWTRMLFSCLIDADREDTISAVRGPLEKVNYPPLEELLPNLKEHIDKCAASSSSARTVNQARNQVLGDCVDKARNLPGLFTLTVPTGGGKTLSSLAFALEHAKIYNKDKVIYVAPFTAIIDQTVQVYREALGGFERVMEHHSNVNPAGKFKFKLAAENWEHPVIATTSVQFLESLFTNHTSRSRKLHNITNSVIILDEAQTIPAKLIAPTLRALEELVIGYGCTIVLCTATQPAFDKSRHFEEGLHIQSTEISSNPLELFRNLKRTEILFRGQMSNDQLVTEMNSKRQALCIVNTKKHAQALYKDIENNNKYHLSAAMCPAHRGEVLKEIKFKLGNNEPVQLVSTSVMEAGVDIDFPEVYRALTGLDSINQSAGRCNRGGKLDIGNVNLFLTQGVTGEQYVKEGSHITQQVLELFPPADLLLPEVTKKYFELYFYRASGKTESLGESIVNLFKAERSRGPKFPFSFAFEDAAKEYRMISSEQRNIFIPWGRKGSSLARELLSLVSNDDFDPKQLQSLIRQGQRFIVSLYKNQFEKFCQENPEVPLIFDGELAVLTELEPWYDPTMGILVDGKENS